MKLFFNQKLSDLSDFCTAVGASPSHGRSLYRHVYKDLQSDLGATPALPKALATELPQQFAANSLKVDLEQLSDDHSVKFLFALEDQAQVESVLMPETSRITLCISSQVGCAQGCVFCQTGRMGLKRNLTAGEMVAQIVSANRWIATSPLWAEACGFSPNVRISNIVFMGMGEPLDNSQAVSDALEIVCNPYGLGLAKRRISVSTAGHLDGLNFILEKHPDVRLAISLHHPDEQERSRIMPINRRWPLRLIMERLRAHAWRPGMHVLIQYTLIGGVNDSLEHAQKLVQLLEGLPVKINIIPWNPVVGSALQEPSEDNLVAFRDYVYRAGLRVMVRYSKGRDIRAACGQLVTRSGVRPVREQQRQTPELPVATTL